MYENIRSTGRRGDGRRRVQRLTAGVRRNELLTLRFGDIDFDQQVIHVRAEHAKSKKTRALPIGTTRLRTLLNWLRIGPAGERQPDTALVFARDGGDVVKSFRTAWELARINAALPDVK